MKTLSFRTFVVCAVLLPAIVQVQGCTEPDPVETITVALRNTETYRYPTVGGDEEGATIITQARHYSISEVRRNSETNWVATYVYQPAPGFVGSDYAEIEVYAGSDGASPPTHIYKVAFRIVVKQ